MSPEQMEQTAQRCAELMWAGDNASRSLGMELVDVGPGRATVRMTVRDDMVNGHGSVDHHRQREATGEAHADRADAGAADLLVQVTGE